MNWSNIRLILAREIRDQLRDRRTMFMILVLPVLLYPLLGMVMFQFPQLMQKRASRVLIVGKANLPQLPPVVVDGTFNPELFESPEVAQAIVVEFAAEESDGERADNNPWVAARIGVDAGDYDAALYFPADFGEKIEQFRRQVQRGEVPDEPPQPEALWNQASERSTVTQRGLIEMWNRWNEAFRETNLAAARTANPEAAHIAESITTPVGLTFKDVREGVSASAAWAKILPVLLLLWALTGAFYPAVDLCAGEKERGTLETLLSSPAQRSEIVLGKLLTIMIFSSLTAILNILSMGIVGFLVFSHQPDFGPPPVLASLWLLVALVPASALFSALCLALAAFARSTKEGQYYLMPLLFVVMPLAAFPAASGMELNLGTSLIPVTGMVLLLRTALEGNVLTALQFLPPVLVVTLVGCLVAIRWAVEQFNAESVLFRESERLEPMLWLRHMLQERRSTPTAAAAVACGVTILLVRFFLSFMAGMPDDFREFAVMTVATQAVAILAPALIFTAMLTTSPRQTLLLRWPSWGTIPAAVLLGLAYHPVVQMIQWAVMRLYPVNEGMARAMEELQSKFAQASLWQLLLLLAVVPAIVEELAFRGFILTGLRRRGDRFGAIALSAVFFGFSHGILQQSIVATLTGLLLGYLAVRSGSLLPGILFHLTNNGLVALSMKLPADLTERWPILQYALKRGEDGGIVFLWPTMVVGVLATAAILGWFLRLRPREPREQERRRDWAR